MKKLSAMKALPNMYAYSARLSNGFRETSDSNTMRPALSELALLILLMRLTDETAARSVNVARPMAKPAKYDGMKIRILIKLAE